jgi:hypothetical protein
MQGNTNLAVDIFDVDCFFVVLADRQSITIAITYQDIHIYLAHTGRCTVQRGGQMGPLKWQPL